MNINIEKLNEYITSEEILEFDSDEECMEYFNTYDYQDLKSVEEMTDRDGMGRAYAKEMMKVYGEMEIDATFGARGLTVAGILGGAAATSRISDPSEDERLKKR